MWLSDYECKAINDKISGHKIWSITTFFRNLHEISWTFIKFGQSNNSIELKSTWIFMKDHDYKWTKNSNPSWTYMFIPSRNSIKIEEIW